MRPWRGPGCSRSCGAPPSARPRRACSRWTTTSSPSRPPPDAGLDDKLDVVKALARLAPIHREVLVLFYFDDMPTAQMAEALEIAPGTVLSRLARARDALKLAMGVPATPKADVNVTPFRRTKT